MGVYHEDVKMNIRSFWFFSSVQATTCQKLIESTTT